MIKKYRRNRLGFLLTKICFYQAKLLKIKKLYSTVVFSNKASFKLSSKAGWKKTGRINLLENGALETEFCKIQNPIR